MRLKEKNKKRIIEYLRYVGLDYWEMSQDWFSENKDDEKELDCIFKFLEKSIDNIKPIDK